MIVASAVAPLHSAQGPSASSSDGVIGIVTTLVNLRLRDRRRALEKIEVAAAVGLGDVPRVHVAEAARIRRLRAASTPRVGGRARRRATCSVRRRAGTSSSMMSPSRTNASGPPTNDSGATCSTHAP